MIVSNARKFVFVHIPKCAGTTVREALIGYDDTDGTFNAGKARDTEAGPVDFRHLPLRQLNEWYPDECAKLETYWSFSICRDPFDRFPSAMAQRLKMYRGVEIAQIGDGDLHREIDAVMAYLRGEPGVIEAGFIHFARQADYIDLDGRRMVKALFPIDGMADLGARLSAHIGEPVDFGGGKNRTSVFRHGGLRGPVMAAKQVAAMLLPRQAQARLRQTARGMLMKPMVEEVPAAFRSDTVRDFIEEYYKDDIRLFAEAKAPR
ncbi:MAG: sulfotransferase family 2 domain-containing protein [Alphaproteobacteria bacterium]